MPTRETRSSEPGAGLAVTYQHPLRVHDRDGTPYRVYAIVEPDGKGRWTGALEFTVDEPGGASFRGGRETTQSTTFAVAYWAAGLGRAHLEGALERARRANDWTPPAAPVLVRGGLWVDDPAGGVGFLCEIYAAWEPSESWVAWVEFRSREGAVRRTRNETSQPTLAAVRYWVEGLEALYFQGALARAAPAE